MTHCSQAHTPVWITCALASALAACSGGSGPTSGMPDPVEQTPPDELVGLDVRPTNTTCLAPEVAPSGDADFKLSPAFPALPALGQIVSLHQPPGESSHWYAMLQPGRIHRFADDPDAASTQTALDIADAVVSQGEQGLLGLAFHPQFATNRHAYVYYSVANPRRSRIARFTVDMDGQFEAASEQVVLEVAQPFGNHNGGDIHFGPDGLLYIGLGDGGSGGDPQNHGQNTDTLLGSMLRIDVDGGPPYAIPADNPFADGNGGRPEIFAWGLRNPFRWSFDALTGELWAGDVGQNAYEEISIVGLGQNLGWNILEGFHCYNASTCDQTGLTPPVAEYPHAAGRSVTGGYVYRGDAIAGLRGRYVFGDFTNGLVWAIDRDAGALTADDAVLETGMNISGFAQDADRELYLLNYGGGPGQNIHRLMAAGDAPAASGVPERLSETGCVTMADPTTPAAGTVSYAPAAAFWSDGADKLRAAALPDGATITRTGDGDFLFPVGSVLIKHFQRAGAVFETRLFMHHPDGWGGYSYRWNDERTEAFLLPDALDEDVAGQPWHYPSRTQCLECHTQVANVTLGLTVDQLNVDHTYPETGETANQLATLAFIDWMARPFSEADRADALADPLDAAANLTDRARAYLDTNCAMCHQPGGTSGVAMDLRAATVLADMGVCDMPPQDTDLGNDQARLLAPGAPDDSLLVLRMERRDEFAMPPLSSRLVDADGSALIRDWIASIDNCPD